MNGCRNILRRFRAFAGTRSWVRVIGGASGFTLLELVLATALSALVMSIVSVVLTFCLKYWEKGQDRRPPETPAIIDQLKWQIASFDPVSVTIDGTKRLIFTGDDHSLVLSTDRSVKALSGDVPVIARYEYSRGEKKLYYAEMPLDPYHQDPILKFMKMKPDTGRKAVPRFYTVDTGEFLLSYKGDDDEAVKNWDSAASAPQAVFIRWSDENGSAPITIQVIPNFVFGGKRESGTETPPGSGGVNPGNQ